MDVLTQLKKKWNLENSISSELVGIKDLISFQVGNNVILPNDLMKYFEFLNGTGGDYTDDFYEFYSLDRLQRIKEEFRNWSGVPNYQDISNLKNPEEVYVFANYNCNLFAYAIRLYPEYHGKNEVYVFCGDEYRIIASSFSEFLSLYLGDSKELYQT